MLAVRRISKVVFKPVLNVVMRMFDLLTAYRMLMYALSVQEGTGAPVVKCFLHSAYMVTHPCAKLKTHCKDPHDVTENTHYIIQILK